MDEGLRRTRRRTESRSHSEREDRQEQQEQQTTDFRGNDFAWRPQKRPVDPAGPSADQVEQLINENPERGAQFIREVLRGHSGANDLLQVIQDIISQRENSAVLDFLTAEEIEAWKQVLATAVAAKYDPDRSPGNESVGKGLVAVAAINQPLELLATAGPEGEASVFESLVRAGRFNTLEDAARTYFPSELVLQLSPDILSRGLMLMGIDEKTGLILSLPERQRRILLDCLQDKARSYLEHEMESYKADGLNRLNIERNASLYWKGFIDFIRQLLRSNEHLALQAEPLLQDWLQAKRRGERRAI
jgi:hypothetical protein